MSADISQDQNMTCVLASKLGKCSFNEVDLRKINGLELIPDKVLRCRVC